MAYSPRPKKTVVKKKPPVKKKPSFLRKDTPRPARDVKPGDLRSQTLANDNKPRPAKDLNKGGLRAKFLKDASQSAASRTLGTVLRTGLRVAGPVGALVSMTVPAGEGSDKPTGPLMKGNNMNPTFPKGKGTASQATKKSSGFGKRISEGAKFERLRATRAALGSKSSNSADATFSKGKGTAALPKGKSSSSSTAATTAAASGSNGGSQASKVGVGRQTRYQRNELAMEQRKRSSSKPKKSIFSLFRKG